MCFPFSHFDKLEENLIREMFFYMSYPVGSEKNVFSATEWISPKVYYTLCLVWNTY